MGRLKQLGYLAASAVLLYMAAGCAAIKPVNPRKTLESIEQGQTQTAEVQSLAKLTKSTTIQFKGANNQPQPYTIPSGFVHNLEGKELYDIHDVVVKIPNTTDPAPDGYSLVPLSELSIEQIFAGRLQGYFGDTRAKVGVYSAEMPYLLVTGADEELFAKLPDHSNLMGTGTNAASSFPDPKGIKITRANGKIEDILTYQNKGWRPTELIIKYDDAANDPRFWINVSAGYDGFNPIEELQEKTETVRTIADLKAFYARNLNEIFNQRPNYFAHPDDLKAQIFALAAERKSVERKVDGIKTDEEAIVIDGLEQIVGIFLFQNHIDGEGYDQSDWVNPATYVKDSFGNLNVRILIRKHALNERGGEAGDDSEYIDVWDDSDWEMEDDDMGGPPGPDDY